MKWRMVIMLHTSMILLDEWVKSILTQLTEKRLDIVWVPILQDDMPILHPLRIFRVIAEQNQTKTRRMPCTMYPK